MAVEVAVPPAHATEDEPDDRYKHQDEDQQRQQMDGHAGHCSRW